MKGDTKRYVDQCAVCQQNKSTAMSPVGLLQPLPIPEHVWDDVTMDFIEGLPKLGRVDTILVFVDHLSKHGHFLTLKHMFNAKSVAEIFICEIVKLHGFP